MTPRQRVLRVFAWCALLALGAQALIRAWLKLPAM